MGQSTNRLVLVILFLGTILVSFNHCLGPAQSKKSGLKYDSTSSSPVSNDNSGDTFTGGTNTGGSGTTTGGSGSNVDVSIQAFGATVHTITRARCINCHGSFQTPLHAVADITQAHNAVVDSFKVNFDNIPSSRMVAKLRDEAHNCWSADCDADATEMEMAIQNWKAQVEAITGGTTTGGGPTPPDPMMTTVESRALIEELDPDNAMDNGTIVLESEAASLAAPMVRGVDNGINYIHVPNGNGGNLPNNNAAAGIGYLNFDNTISDAYKIYALVDAPGNADNSFHIKVDNGNYQEWHITETTGFEWREVSTTANQNPVNFFIPAGNGHVLEVRQREDGTKISRVVVSNDPNINLDDVSNAVIATITYDISNLVGAMATFTIDIQEYDMYSYKLSNPTITSNARVRVKSIKPLINGNYNPQHATYTLVDTTTLGGTTVLSPSALIALKDQGSMIDRLSFSFEIIQQQ